MGSIKNQNTRISVARLLFSSLLIGLVALLQFGMISQEPSFKTSDIIDWNSIRLPPNVFALNYKLNFSTDLQQKQDYGGTCIITLNITESTRVIVVHSVGLDMVFEGLSSALDASKSFPLLKRETKEDLEYTVFSFARSLSSGVYILSISYRGQLSSGLSGYYLSTYHLDNDTDPKGHNIATTQFEPTDARRAFPCLDEPSQKASFEITMLVQDGFHALSNMPVKNQRSLFNNWNEFQFEKTVKMSTYLVAFIVSDFVKVSSKTKSGVDVSVWTAPTKQHLGEYALKVGTPILEFYEETFGINFPLPKLDMIAIPDFSAGAMENWGLVTYRDTALLFDPKSSTAANKQRVATVVGHELAHQWFGNLVTMKWWTDLWLNEGFAEFMEYKAVNSVEPKWDMLAQFIPLDLVRCLHADESYYTHKIAIPVSNPSEISSIFDDISYGKGSSILRMLESWMDEKYGNGTFFNKLHGYLNEHKYGNAETKMLWDSLEMPGQNIAEIMATWTDQPGFPFLTFERITSDSFTVTQERFIFANLVEDLPETNDTIQFNLNQQMWSVPITYSLYSNSSGSPKEILRGFAELSTLGAVEITFNETVPEGSVLLANYLQNGVYRSLYDERTYRYLIDWLRKDLDLFPAVERGGFISDVFSMTFAGHLKDPTIALDLSTVLGAETNVLVWNTALKDLESLKNVFALDPLYGKIVEFQTSLEESVLESIGWTESSPSSEYAHGRALLRGALLSEAVRNNHYQTVETARNYFRDIKAGRKPLLSADVFPAIYDAGVIYGDLEDYTFVMEMFKKSTFAPEQAILLHALAATKTPYLQAKTLAFAISGQVRKQDIQSVIANVVNLSPVGHISAWVFVMDNWEKLLQIFDGMGFGKFNDLLKDIVGSFTKHYLIDEAERLFIRQIDPEFVVPAGAKVAVMKGLETAKQLLAWKDLYSSDVENWLTAHCNSH